MSRRDYRSGTISERGPRKYQLRWMDPPDPITGKSRRRTLTLTNLTKNDAKGRLRALTAGGRTADTSAITLDEAIIRWRHDTRHANGTQRNYDLARRSIPDRAATTPLAGVTVDVMRTIVTHVTTEHGPHRGRLVHALISGALNYAWQQHWLAENIAKRVPRPTARRKNPRGEPTPDQIRELVAYVSSNPQYVAWLAVHSDTGARRQEVLALRWRNINLDSRNVFIEDAIDPIDGTIKDTKTEGSVRPVSIGLLTVDRLLAWRAAMEKRANDSGTRLHPDAFVFSDALDGLRPWRPDRATKRFAKLRKDLGIVGVSLRDLRHYVATQLLGAGYDPKNVAARLGHTRVATTEDVYANRLLGRDQAMADHLATL